MNLSRTTAAHMESARRGSINRANNEFSTETWALDPLDVMTAEQFEQHLVSLYGAEYLEPVQFHRHHGKFEVDPVRTEVAELFRQYGMLTRLEVQRLTGYGNGRIADIVKPPTYVIACVAKVSRGYANKWRLAKEKLPELKDEPKQAEIDRKQAESLREAAAERREQGKKQDERSNQS